MGESYARQTARIFRSKRALLYRHESLSSSMEPSYTNPDNNQCSFASTQYSREVTKEERGETR